MRVFVGLYSDQLSEEPLNQSAQLLSGVSLHYPKDRHMTMCFLGERSTTEIEDLVEEVEVFYNKKLFKPVSWDTLEISDFPCSGPKVWAVKGEDNDHLMTLQQNVVQACGNESNYTFIPHVTLAYLKAPSKQCVKFEDQWQFNQLRVYRAYTQQERGSLERQGKWAKPRYKVVKSWVL